MGTAKTVARRDRNHGCVDARELWVNCPWHSGKTCRAAAVWVLKSNENAGNQSPTRKTGLAAVHLAAGSGIEP